MSNLDNFTNDEQLLLLNIASLDALINKVAELTDNCPIRVRYSVAISTGDYLRGLSDDDVEAILEQHRSGHLEARQLAKSQSSTNNN